MSATPIINTTKQVIPQVYAYTTPEIARHNGWTKIGYTEQDVRTRIEQQTHTADVRWNLEWQGNAIFEGTAKTFTDKDFHAYLRKYNVQNEPTTEWFKISGQDSKMKFYDFRASNGIAYAQDIVVPYVLREEQNAAVEQTLKYAKEHENGEFLWNAKPRFGKTLAAYDFCKRFGAQNVLIVTNRPAIANSWYSDYIRFVGSDSGYLFVSEIDALKGKPGVLSRADFTQALIDKADTDVKCIEFVSLQDLKGSVYFGGHLDKLAEISDDKDKGIKWDVLVVDEAHEGVDTYKTDIAFDHILRRFTIHLSGTPFKALANNKFADDAIYNWTYADEQQKKYAWNDSKEEENPYLALPRLNLFTYQMSEIVKDELQQGIEIEGETGEYAFDLNEFFSTNNGRFVHNSSVDKFLDALTVQKRFPFSTESLRNEIKHSFWLLDRVESAKALANKLKNHPVFKDYEIVLAAGDGRIDDEDEIIKSYDKVVKAIKEHDKTITLSVGQLTTGITIPEWTAVLMLSNVKSPALYMQAAFRAQNPCLFTSGVEYRRKENAYVFDFDPARTLIIFEEFANDLQIGTASGRGDTEARKNNVKELLNFFPVIGEDENGELVELDAEKVLTIPRKIKSQEVVRRGFMSNFLFQNISNIFNAPKEVLDIIEALPQFDDKEAKVTVSKEVAEKLSLDENGNVSLDDEYVIGQANDLFGEKIYGVSESLQTAIDDTKVEDDDGMERLKDVIRKNTVNPMVEFRPTQKA